MNRPTRHLPPDVDGGVPASTSKFELLKPIPSTWPDANWTTKTTRQRSLRQASLEPDVPHRQAILRAQFLKGYFPMMMPPLVSNSSIISGRFCSWFLITCHAHSGKMSFPFLPVPWNKYDCVNSSNWCGVSYKG